MNTIFISAFPGSGKTYLCGLHNGKYNEFTVVDMDGHCLKDRNDFLKYANEITELNGKYDIVFISQYPEVLKILHSRGIEYTVVAPNNLLTMSNRFRALNKQQWFGRFVLRQNKTEWIELLKKNYEQWTNIKHLENMNPNKIILLNHDEYLSDIIDDIITL